MGGYHYGYCQYCKKEYKNRSEGRMTAVVNNHEMVCPDNPNKKKSGTDLKEALDKAREELGEW